MSDVLTASYYAERALAYLNPEVRERGPEEMLLNAALGLAGEAGEIADHVKKWRYQGHPLEIGHLKDEQGDLCWYIAQMCEALDKLGELGVYDFDAVLSRNLRKLKARYPSGRFERDRSVNREIGG